MVGAGASFLYWRSRNASASLLKDPDALKLDPQSPEQLVGRGEDLRRLLNAASNSIVFLVSESGCGKSALLRAGVAQDPAFAVRFLPIYIDMSVLDWERGPLQAVREGFSGPLPAASPSSCLGTGKSPPPSHTPPDRLFPWVFAGCVLCVCRRLHSARRRLERLRPCWRR